MITDSRPREINFNKRLIIENTCIFITCF